jgi:hypothetical protein
MSPGRRSLLGILAIAGILVSAPVSAEPFETRVGVEWTVTRFGLMTDNYWKEEYISPEGPANSKAIEQIFELYTKLCSESRGCRVEWGNDKYWYDTVELIYDDGTKVIFGPDVQVVEISMTPVNEARAEELERRIQHDVFDVLAENLDLRPHPEFGGGHLSLDAAIFDANPLLFINYFIDYANHPELSREPSEDATPIADLPQECRDAFGRIVEDVRAQLRSGHITSTTTELAQRIRREVYAPAAPALKEDVDWVAKNMALNIEHLVDRDTPQKYRRLEDRAVPPQENYHIFLLEYKLKVRRLELLASKDQVLEYVHRQYTSEAERDAAFQAYVADTNLPVTQYKVLLPKHRPRHKSQPCNLLARRLYDSLKSQRK